MRSVTRKLSGWHRACAGRSERGSWNVFAESRAVRRCARERWGSARTGHRRGFPRAHRRPSENEVSMSIPGNTYGMAGTRRADSVGVCRTSPAADTYWPSVGARKSGARHQTCEQESSTVEPPNEQGLFVRAFCHAQVKWLAPGLRRKVGARLVECVRRVARRQALRSRTVGKRPNGASQRVPAGAPSPVRERGVDVDTGKHVRHGGNTTCRFGGGVPNVPCGRYVWSGRAGVGHSVRDPAPAGGRARHRCMVNPARRRARLPVVRVVPIRLRGVSAWPSSAMSTP